MNKQRWYDNKDDLATKPIFNICFQGVFMCSLIIGTQGIAYSLGWESYVLAIFSALMLMVQNNYLLEVLTIHNKRRDSKQGGKKE